MIRDILTILSAPILSFIFFPVIATRQHFLDGRSPLLKPLSTYETIVFWLGVVIIQIWWWLILINAY